MKRKIQKTVTVKIVTSGYSDRYVSSEGIYHYGDAAFSDEDRLINFLIDDLGQSFDEAWDAVKGAPVTYTISGYITPGHFMQTKIDSRDVSLLMKFLLNGNRNIAELGFNSNITAILNWQLRECNRINTERHGYPDGWEGVWRERGARNA